MSEPSASPYGPAGGTAAPPLTAGPVDAPAVARARRVLRLIAIIVTSAGLVTSVLFLGLLVIGGGTLPDLGEPGEEIVIAAALAGPFLVVLGLNALVWLPLVRPLARMTRGRRVTTVVGTGALLSLLSIALVVVLVFVGFLGMSLILSSADRLS